MSLHIICGPRFIIFSSGQYGHPIPPPVLCPAPSLSRPVIACRPPVLRALCPPSAHCSILSLPEWHQCRPLLVWDRWKVGVMSWLDASALVLSPTRHTGPSAARLPAHHQTPAARPHPGWAPIPEAPDWAMGHDRRHHSGASQTPSSQSIQHPADRYRQARAAPLLSYRVHWGLIKSSIIYPHHHPDLHLPPLGSKSHLHRFQSPLSQRPAQGCSNPCLKGAGGRWRGQRGLGALGRIGKGTALVCPPHCLLKDIAYGGRFFLSGRMKAAADRGYDWV